MQRVYSNSNIIAENPSDQSELHFVLILDGIHELSCRFSEDDIDKQPGAWEEDFVQDNLFIHHDSKPNGPEAVALDFTFPQAQVLFGMHC